MSKRERGTVILQWYYYIEEIISTWSPLAVTIRLVVALLAGALIGFERGLKGRSARLKTHALVCVGAALVMVTSEYIANNFTGDTDLTRMGAQVISGVGFLGVGTIIVTGKNQVRGLTTAAGLWACACVGLAIGVGFLLGAIVALVGIFIILRVLSQVDNWLDFHAREHDIYIEFENAKYVGAFLSSVRKDGIRIIVVDISKGKLKGEGPNGIFNVVLPNNIKWYTFVEQIKKHSYIRHIERL